MVYPQSIISAYDYYDGDKENYLTALNVAMMPKVNASDNYVNFLTKTLSGISNDDPIVNVLRADGKNSSERTLDAGWQYKKSIISVQNGENTAIIDALNPLRNDSMTRMQRDTGQQRDVEGTNVIFGNDITKAEKLHGNSDIVALSAKIIVNAPDSVAVGYGAQVDNSFTVAVGHLAYAVGKKSIAIGGEGRSGSKPIPIEGRTIATGEESIAIGHRAKADSEESIAFGAYSKTTVNLGVALGSESVADVAAGAIGYNSLTKGPSDSDDMIWASTLGAVSVGDAKSKKTRQIVGVAAGSGDTDAVNVAQLKSLQKYVDQGWTLSVGGKNAKAVGVQDTVDLSAASDNLKITKGEENNNVTFDLANNITVERVTAGRSSISDDGILFADGAKITVDGIDAGNKQITGVAAGEEPDDAVNFAQLEQVNRDVASVSQNTSQYFGGGADVSNGKAPTYTIQGNSHNDVGSAFNAVDTSITNIQNQIANATKNSLVKQEGDAGTITIGVTTGGTEINVANKSGEARTISGVKAAERNDEAVNKAQLDKSIEKISNDINLTSAAVVLYDKENGTVNYGSVTLGGMDNQVPVALHNVKDGKIAEDSHDAINGNQINKISGDIANYFGGGASFENGAFKGPNYSLSVIVEDGQVAKAKYHDVGSALSGLDANVKSVNSHLTNVVNNFTQQINDITQEVKGDALLWNGDEQAFVAQHGADKENSKIKFLANGDISANSTDAINGSQLYLMSNQLAAYFGGGAGYNNGEWTAPTFKIAQFKADGSSGEKKAYHNVASAFDGVSESMSKINDRIQSVENNVSSNGLNWNEQKKAYDASHDGQPSKIINVADGKIAEGSKDAVNGGQLWETNERITGVEKDIKHIENRVDNISTTVTNIGETVFNIEDRVDNIENTVNNLSDGAVNYDKDADGKKTNKITLKGGNESEPVMIDNVANGRIEQGSKEAVNGGQLHDYTQQQMKIVLDDAKKYTDSRVDNIVINAIDDAVDRSDRYTDMKFNILSYDIKSVRKEARQAAAVGLAVSNLRYFDEPGSLSVSFGSGAWRGQSAFALGAGYTSENGKIRSNL
ncbi:Vomp family autotransporter, partial [Bartonella sp. AP7XZML]|uniref:Vomp family autotransporter n=1 Tax=Bartonella sp. AP7XZML TaxID=3243503 RepID=UPI0035CF6F67